MAEILENGNFSDSFNHWVNGADGAESFYIDSNEAEADSPGESEAQTWYKMYQAFSRTEELKSVRLSVSAAWDTHSGTVSGQARIYVALEKPGGEFIVVYNTLYSGGNTSGMSVIIDELSIRPYMDEWGTYKVHLRAETRTAKTEQTEDCDSPYGSWNRYGFTLYESNAKCRYFSSELNNDEYATAITKSFYSVANPETARISVKARGVAVTSAPDLLVPGTCVLRVELDRPTQGRVVLYEASHTDGTWPQILSNLDISSYLTETGTYTIRLGTTVKSAKFRVTDPIEVWYERSEGHFWVTNVDISYTIWEKSYANFDNISVLMKVYKAKTVMEFLGGAGDFGKQKTITKHYLDKEIISVGLGLRETYSKTYFSPRDFFDEVITSAVELVETVKKVVRKTVTEVLEFTVSYFPFADYIRGVTEELGLVETYSHVRRKLGSHSVKIGLLESLTAKKIIGNLEITLDFLSKEIEWDSVAQESTKWIKSKIINS